MKKYDVLVDVGNDFYEKYLKELIKELDQGKKVEPYVNCIGHTRNNMTQERYRTELKNHYGNKLHIELSEGAYSYSYIYWLER